MQICERDLSHDFEIQYLLCIHVLCLFGDCRVIYDLFRDPDPNSLKNATGIQLLGVILANKLAPYNSAAGVDKER